MDFKSWRETISQSQVAGAQETKIITSNFGEGWPITMGLRFGECAGDGKTKDGECVAIYSRVTILALQGWQKYRSITGLEGSTDLYLVPEFIQVDDRKWSVCFDFSEPVPREILDDLAEYLVEYFFPLEMCQFNVWTRAFVDLDGEVHSRVGLTEGKYEQFGRASFEEERTIPNRTAVMIHHPDGSLIHIKKRATAVCQVCEFSGEIWCDPEQVEIVDQFNWGPKRDIDALLDAIGIWNAFTYFTGVHQWCLQAQTKDPEKLPAVKKMYEQELRNANFETK
jgi:hypothetical protein